ncbi:MAG TPA: hypothetical protein VFS43_33725 [Polyangiaceae bacterium]|nr:hypothetical protein [Polyangiaceae bacterium]
MLPFPSSVRIYLAEDRGTFRRVREAGSGRAWAEVDGAELGLLLEGIDLRGAKRGARWRPPTTDVP